MKNILHICNNYISSTVHKDLILAMTKKKINSTIFVPIRTLSHHSINQIEHESVDTIYKVVPNNFLKFFALFKVFYVFILMLPVLKKRKYDSIIAHTMWSDGAIALLAHIFFKIDYVVCVRNTDVNVFLKYLVWYRPIQKLICKKAKAVVFISPALKKDAFLRYGFVFKGFEKKIVTIPNGLHTAYLKDMHLVNLVSKEVIKCCFVGKADENKNLQRVIDAVGQINLKGKSTELTIVGLSKEDAVRFNPQKTWCHFVEPIKDKYLMKEMYQEQHVLVVPSFKETFGLVYVEAISQGCNIVCSTDQGVSGLFLGMDKVHQADPSSIDSIANAIVLAFNHTNSCDDVVLKNYIESNFDWLSIADRYLDLIVCNSMEEKR